MLRAGARYLTGGALGRRWQAGPRLQAKHPIDGYLALAAAAATLVLATDPDGLAVEARSVMSVASGIFAFRKGEEWAKGHKDVPHHSSW